MSHTTHFDDCGCQSAALRKRIAELEQRDGEFDKLHAVQVARVEILIGEKVAQAERIATLEAELAEVRAECARWELGGRIAPLKIAAEAIVEGEKWQAHAATLRDALEKCDCETLTNGMGEYEGHNPKCARCAALASTPAADLSALKAELLEPYIAALSAWRAIETAEGTDCSEFEMSALWAEAHTLTTRALAAHAATHSELEVKP